ncbi:ABC transporter ATP-binding protein [Candidatus Izimaplasma bacterium ZiA1]|uniref:ABC transporter ATP-binding protein n=1 Tax=Candidatus Izimoplasma sp. ZiA1 TaxID=2024899 RepID=UPI000BAA7C0A|nr:ABC transporter ATP-binding protein [Candidatus Izimaplasma bacterium ZiA1]
MNIIETKNITKKFGIFTANDSITLNVKQGDILAIAGENGAGKTTLMNMLYGLSKPTSGTLHVKGQEVSFNSPLDAINLGLGMVHQHFKLVPSLSIYENVLLGIEIKKEFKIKNKSFSLPFIDKKKEIKKVQEVADKYKLELDVTDLIKDISVGSQQRVEILKMLYRNVDVLILDEPTAVLTPQEVDDFILNLKELKAQGKTIIMITHKLREVMELSDCVAVLKRGALVATLKTKETSEKELSRLMVGRDVLLTVSKNHKKVDTEVVYKVTNLETKNELGKKVLSDISFEIKKGEILGVAGVEGNGQSELAKVLCGLMTTSNGNVIYKGENITNMWPINLRKKGISFVPEDRYVDGLCLDMTIADNIIAGNHWNETYFKHKLYQKKIINKERDNLKEKYDIRISDIDGNVSSLSGGNAQKIIIAREFSRNPDALIISQPTRGVDVGSIEFIHSEILKMQEENKAILLISSELSEVMTLSDRIIVMYKGAIIGEVDAANSTKEELGLLMAGIKEEA